MNISRSVCGLVVVGSMKKWIKSFFDFIATKAYEKYCVEIGNVNCTIYRIESGAIDLIYPTTLDFFDEYNYIYFLRRLERDCPYPIKSFIFALNYSSDVYIHIISQINIHTTYPITLVTMLPGRSLEKFMELQVNITNFESCFLNFQLPITMSLLKFILKYSSVESICNSIEDDEEGILYEAKYSFCTP